MPTVFEDKFKEIRHSRALACALDNALENGYELPLEVLQAYEKLKLVYIKQQQEGIS